MPPPRAQSRAARCSGGAEQRIAGLGALQEQVQVVLPGEADAAVELKALFDDEALALAGLDLGERRRLGAARIVLDERERRVVAECSCALDCQVHVREPVLQRLERADRAVVLLAQLRVLERQLEDAPAGADGCKRERDRRDFERSRDGALGRRPGREQQRSACTATPSSRRSASANVGSISVRSCALTAARGTRKTPSPASARATSAISSARARRIRRLRPGALAHRPGVACGRGEVPAVVLGEGHAAAETTLGDALQQAPGERRFGSLLEQRSELRRRREEGARCSHTAELLGHEAQLNRAEPEPALRIGDRDPRPGQRHHLLPERGARLAALVHGARQRGRALLLEHTPHAIAQCALLLRELEVHQLPPGTIVIASSKLSRRTSRATPSAAAASRSSASKAARSSSSRGFPASGASSGSEKSSKWCGTTRRGAACARDRVRSRRPAGRRREQEIDGRGRHASTSSSTWLRFALDSSTTRSPLARSVTM
jgi:hypothetical protein